MQRYFLIVSFFSPGFDTILLGAKNNKSLDLPIASEKFEIKEVKNSLAEIGFDSPEMLLSMFVARLSDKNKIWDAGDLNTDNRPHIEFSAPKVPFIIRLPKIRLYYLSTTLLYPMN